jgi:thioredoxin reductase
MQRRHFISNMAVILPAGMVAPKLLFETTPGYKKLVETNVLVLGAGTAGLFITKQLNKEKATAILLEPSSGTNNDAAYNHTIATGFIQQKDQQQRAEVKTLTHQHHAGMEETVTLNFVPTAITRTENGFIVTDGTIAYSAPKLILALPVQMDELNKLLKVAVSGTNEVAVCCKRKNQKKPVSFSTLSAGKIDEQQIVKFVAQKSPGILAVL